MAYNKGLAHRGRMTRESLREYVEYEEHAKGAVLAFVPDGTVGTRAHIVLDADRAGVGRSLCAVARNGSVYERAPLDAQPCVNCFENACVRNHRRRRNREEKQREL